MGLDWVECPNSFFEQGQEFCIEKGWMTIEEGKAKVTAQPDKALGLCVQPGDDDDPDAQRSITVVPIGTQKYKTDGWTCWIYKKTLPGSDDPSIFTDEYCDGDDFCSDGYDFQRPGRGEGLGDGVRALSLFSGVDPNDMDQGGLGDCWLISAFAAMSEFPDALMALFGQKTIAEDGHYSVKLYSFQDKGMQTYEIDDRFPVRNGRCAYVKITEDGEIWPCLLEKAFAAYSGGYEVLDGGFSVFAFGAMTGCTDLHFYRRDPDNDCWHERTPTWETNNVHDATWGGYISDPTDDEVFQMIADADKNNFLMCAGSHSGSDTDTDDSGVVQGHAYTLLTVKPNVCDSGINLLQLRNPWGSGEWKGDWSDGSSMWDDHPEIAEECGYEKAEDGLFWIDWEDFKERYSTIYVCRQNMGTNRGKKTQAATKEMKLQGEELLTKVSPALSKKLPLFTKLLKMFGCTF